MTIALVFAVANANDTPTIIGYNTYVVANEDTLWDIANQLGYNHIDIRRIIYDIQQASDLRAEYIHRGDVLQIPIYEED